MKQKFYSRLSYSIGNEDWKTEQAALKIKPRDRVITVTASGDRPLNLLYNECSEIVCVDANPFQNALCDLKRVALAELDYDHYLGFLGATSSKHRLETYKGLESKLQPQSIYFWKRHDEKINKGILYQGAVEKLLKTSSHFINLMFGKTVNQLFNCDSLQEQEDYIAKKWNERTWRKALQLILNPLVTRYILKDPGLYAYVDPTIDISYYIHDRIFSALKRFPAKENILASLACFGKVFQEGFSPYLTYEGTNSIKKNADKITLATNDVISYLEEAPDESFDCFSLSDVASYIPKKDFNRMCYALYRTAKPGARFCIRQFLSAYTFPDELTPYLQRDEELEKKLEKEDRCFIYRFLVGRVIK